MHLIRPFQQYFIKTFKERLRLPVFLVLELVWPALLYSILIINSRRKLPDLEGGYYEYATLPSAGLHKFGFSQACSRKTPYQPNGTVVEYKYDSSRYKVVMNKLDFIMNDDDLSTNIPNFVDSFMHYMIAYGALEDNKDTHNNQDGKRDGNMPASAGPGGTKSNRGNSSYTRHEREVAFNNTIYSMRRIFSNSVFMDHVPDILMHLGSDNGVNNTNASVCDVVNKNSSRQIYVDKIKSIKSMLEVYSDIQKYTKYDYKVKYNVKNASVNYTTLFDRLSSNRLLFSPNTEYTRLVVEKVNAYWLPISRVFKFLKNRSEVLQEFREAFGKIIESGELIEDGQAVLVFLESVDKFVSEHFNTSVFPILTEIVNSSNEIRKMLKSPRMPLEGPLLGVNFIGLSNNTKTPSKVNYEIITYSSVLPMSNIFWQNNFEDDPMDYLNNFWSVAQDLVDISIMKVATNNSFLTNLDKKVKLDFSPCDNSARKNIVKMKTAAPIFTMGILMSTLYICRHLVAEKSSQLDSYFNSIGINKALYIFATTFCNVLFGIVSITIAVILVRYSGVFHQTNIFLIIFYFSGFVVSANCLAVSISLLVDNPSIACLIAGTLLNTLLIPHYVLRSQLQLNTPSSIHFAFSLLFSTSFAEGLTVLFEIEDVRMTALTSDFIFKKYLTGNEFPFGYYLIILYLDGFIYIAATLLCKFAIKKLKECFSKVKPLVRKMMKIPQSDGYQLVNSEEESNSDQKDFIEDSSPALVTLDKIYVSYVTGIYALKNVSLKMFEDRVVSLLGHNGAGKSTMINTIVGNIKPLSGSVKFCDNLAQEGFCVLGYCPQTSILIDRLTVLEQLYFYYYSLSPSETLVSKSHFLQILSDIKLEDKQDSFPHTLSGGQQRILCVAIAFMCNPRIVILDEPTAGVDQLSRSIIWGIIERNRKGKAILICTHFMDEAEILGDDIVIMNKSMIHIKSDALTLKSKHGNGIRLTMIKANPEKIKPRISEYLGKFFTDHIFINETTDHIIYEFPRDSRRSRSCETMLQNLSRDLPELGLKLFGLNDCTMEDVFINVTNNINAGNNSSSDISTVTCLDTDNTHFSNDSKIGGRTRLESISRLLCENVSANYLTNKLLNGMKRKMLRTIRDKTLVLTNVLIPLIMPFTSTFITYMILRGLNTTAPVNYPEMTKLRDTVLPISYFGSNVHNLNQVFVELLRDADIDKQSTGVSNIKGDINRVCPYFVNDTCKLFEKPIEDAFKYFDYSSIHHSRSNQNLRYDIAGNCSIENYLLWTRKIMPNQRYFSLEFTKSTNDDGSPSEDVIHIVISREANLGVPIAVNMLNNIIFRLNARNSGIVFDQEPKITVINSPEWHLTRGNLMLKVETMMNIVIMVSLGFCLATSAFVIMPIIDRNSGFKKTQQILGLSSSSYWAANYICDFATHIVPTICCLLIFRLFSIQDFYSGVNLFHTFGIIVTFGFANISFGYFLSNLFENPHIAYTAQTLIGFSTVLLFAQLNLLIFIPLNIAEAKVTLIQNIFSAILYFNLQHGFQLISSNFVNKQVFERFGVGSYKSLSFDFLGKNMVSLVITGVVFFLLQVLVDYCTYFSKRNKRYTKIVIDDSDSSQWMYDVLNIENLKKLFKSFGSKGVQAVNGVDISVKKGQCYGLLGLNGAGKTTIFKVIVEDIAQTSGTVSIKIKKNQVPYTYCSQFDSLDMLLTPEEHLLMLCNLCGYSKERSRNITMALLQYFDLVEYRNYRLGHLSHGNRRKLSVAITMIGNPSIILMDEPTTGMDPISRRMILKFISHVVEENKSVVLTTHSINDCDEACSVIGIMVKGEMKYVGTPTSLKETHGQGYELQILCSLFDKKHLIGSILDLYAGSRLMNASTNSISIFLPITYQSLHELFNSMENMRETHKIHDYFVYQLRTDQVFMDIVMN